MEHTFLSELLGTLKKNPPEEFFKKHLSVPSSPDHSAEQSAEPALQEPSAAPSEDEEKLRLQTNAYELICRPVCLSLQHAILAGEYYLKICFSNLREIMTIISSHKEIVETNFPNDENMISMLNMLLDQLSKFEHFAESIQYRLKFAHEVMIEEGVFEKSWTNININELVQWSNHLEEAPPDNFDLHQEKYLFDINLKLAFIDTTLESAHLNSLFILADFLNKRSKAKVYHISRILFDKCQYIIYKIVNRNDRGHWPDSHITLKASKTLHANVNPIRKFGGEEIDIKNPKLEYYKYFKDLTDSRYNYNHVTQLDDRKEAEIHDLWKDTIEKISQSGAELNYIEIHELSRYLHKSGTRIKGAFEKSKTLYDIVYRYICKNDDATYGRFNKYAYHSLVSLLSINHLKLAYNYFKEAIASQNNDEIVKWKKRFDECFRITQEVAQERNVISFNGFRVYLKGYTEYFENILYSLSHKINIEEFNKDVKEISPLFSDFKNSIDWGREKKYMALFLPFETSFYTVHVAAIDKNIRLFLDSSYMLPSNFDLLVTEYQEMHNSFQQKIILVLQKITYTRLNEVETATNTRAEALKAEVGQKVQDNQYKNIEILSLFTAVIAFIVVGASTFPDFNDFYIMFLFMFGLSLCLGFFVLFIDYVVTKHFNRRVLFPVGTAMGLFILFASAKIIFPEKTLLPFRTPTDKTNDTITLKVPASEENQTGRQTTTNANHDTTVASRSRHNK